MQKTEREPKDDYATPSWQSRLLFNYITPQGLIFEPCAGAGAMEEVLRDHLCEERVMSGDLYHTEWKDFEEFDATDPGCWHEAQEMWGQIDWVITNPPFRHAMKILDLAHTYARCGVALILRSTFCEPTEERGPFLAQHPPDLRVVMPRWKYREPSVDSVTTEWHIWLKVNKARGTVVVPRADIPHFQKEDS